MIMLVLHVLLLFREDVVGPRFDEQSRTFFDDAVAKPGYIIILLSVVL